MYYTICVCAYIYIYIYIYIALRWPLDYDYGVLYCLTSRSNIRAVTVQGLFWPTRCRPGVRIYIYIYM